MTPEKLEAWAEYHDDEGRYAEATVEHREFARWLTRLAAKMREPDRWLCAYATKENRRVTIAHDKPDEHAESSRPILYLDSLEGDDG